MTPGFEILAAFRLGHGGAVRGMIPAQAPYEGEGAHEAQLGSYSEELVWMLKSDGGTTMSRKSAKIEQRLGHGRCGAGNAPHKPPKGEAHDAQGVSRGPCWHTFKEMVTQLRTPPGEIHLLPPWTPSVRVDVEPRAPSDCQFRHWRVCAPWQSRPLQPHKTESSIVSNKRRWRVRQLAWWRSGAVQVIIPALGSRSDLCVVVVTTSQCSKGEECCFVATSPEM